MKKMNLPPLKEAFIIKEPQDEPAGIYIHIPFCLSKCSYCDFFSITDLSFKGEFLNALSREIILSPGKHLKFDSLYIGGGTPSILPPESIAEIIDKTAAAFNLDSNAEITMEANPATLNRENLKQFKMAGINRLTLGVQSFDCKNLKFLGRLHSGKEGAYAVEIARKCDFENINIDLIYGIPGQTEKMWLKDLQQGVNLEPTHLSCYMLTFEPGTEMGKRLQKKDFRPMPESRICNLMNLTTSFVASKGYTRYEISNYALGTSCSDYRSRHNRKYWSSVPYIGLGPSAHSFIEPVRYKNISSVKEYIKSLKREELPVEGKELLNKNQRMTEEILLGLRETNGFNLVNFNQKFKTDFLKKFHDPIKTLEKLKFIQTNKNRCKLTNQGILYHNSIAAMLTEFE